MEVKELTTSDAAYIAGLIDRDGVIIKSGATRQGGPVLTVKITATERHLLEHVHQTVGVGTVSGARAARIGPCPEFSYTLHDGQAFALLRQVQPHLRTYKAGRARIILRAGLPETLEDGGEGGARWLRVAEDSIPP